MLGYTDGPAHVRDTWSCPYEDCLAVHTFNIPGKTVSAWSSVNPSALKRR
jgi:hypothetical protein